MPKTFPCSCVLYFAMFPSSPFLSSLGFISSLYLSVRHNFCLSRQHFAQSVALDTFLSTRSKVRLEKCWPLKSHYVNTQNIAASLAFLTYLSFLFRITFPLTRRYTTYYHLFSFSVENVFFFLLPAMNNCMFESSFFAVATAAAYYSFLFIFNFLDHIHCCVAARCKPTIPIIVVGSFCSFILSMPTMDLCEMNNKNSFCSVLGGWLCVLCVSFFVFVFVYILRC